MNGLNRLDDGVFNSSSFVCDSGGIPKCWNTSMPTMVPGSLSIGMFPGGVNGTKQNLFSSRRKICRALTSSTWFRQLPTWIVPVRGQSGDLRFAGLLRSSNILDSGSILWHFSQIHWLGRLLLHGGSCKGCQFHHDRHEGDFRLYFFMTRCL